MKRTYKIIAWSVGGIVLLTLIVLGCIKLKDILTPTFKSTKIKLDVYGASPSDTTINVNGVMLKMIGIKGGYIDCRGHKKTIVLSDFYISETEVTQELWTAIMDDNPSMHNIGDSLPVQNINLNDCITFTTKLSSATGISFYIPSYPQWLYAANLGLSQAPPNKLDSIAWHKGNSGNTIHAVKQKHPDNNGVYDMFGNVAEWTMSGPDPLCIVAGGSFYDNIGGLDMDYHDFDHFDDKSSTVGFRVMTHHF